ncbi:phosphatase PAP2 family protein [Arthrobacter sp. ZGTC131]|uniref:phosphatase PAP2 family protein n=1 Tax=Arthrobacter sp. ZGTC131 TaxID=2058898 RepID=UPI00215795B4|nr:phosphatase PAP2 family protein [Arthrobacter sp. ZGTC131]
MSKEPRSQTDEGIGEELNQDRLVEGRDLTRADERSYGLLVRAVRGTSNFLGPYGPPVLALLPGAAIIAGMTAAFARVCESVLGGDGVAQLDHPALVAGKSLRSPAMDLIVTAYAYIGDTVGMLLLTLAATIALTISRRTWTPAILILIAGTGSLLMTIAGKRLIGRTRPAPADAVPPFDYSPSFPSGHSLNSVVIVGIIAYLLVPRLKRTRSRVLTLCAAAMFAVTMGLSGVYLGHHWLTDVLGAGALGAAWLALIITAHCVYLALRKQRTPPPG